MIETVEQLNAAIGEGRFVEIVRDAEAFHADKLARIADRVALRKPAVRLVLLAGPSSSGKTTTALRLCSQLETHGLETMLVSTDDYFVGDARNPRKPDGSFDYECLEAVDGKRLTADLNALLAGETVRLRRFDFLRHEGEDRAEAVALPSDGVIVVEGIHALNPALTRDVPDAAKFRVYLNAKSNLSAAGRRVAASDVRLVRRLVRDGNYRGRDAASTFALWPDVLAGERKWIYPYRKRADAIFNTSLAYEISVLRPYVAPMLAALPAGSPAARAAQKIAALVARFRPAPDDAVPGDSILRETIGGSRLAY